jgi:hypothetical protein
MLNLPGNTAVGVEEETTAPDGSNKLKKNVTVGPPPGAGPSGTSSNLTPQEKAMEDARTLASKSYSFVILA